jgi:hypothetical protein
MNKINKGSMTMVKKGGKTKGKMVKMAMGGKTC